MARGATNANGAGGQTLLPWGSSAAPQPILPAKPHPLEQPALLAPPPVVDRWPILIGQNLSLAYLTNTYMLATQGWRWQWVDVVNELLEHDPHARGVCRQRFLPVVAARLEVLPAELPEGAEQSDKDLAKKVADEVRRQIKGIPAWTQALGRLVWGIGYGMSAAESEWCRDTGSMAPKGWEVRGLSFVHSRRLNVTNPSTWDVHIYDQGPTGPGAQLNYGFGYGLPLRAYPGKFILHAPALNGDYATRDGEFRYIGAYLLIKRMMVRVTAQDFERFVRPWVLGYFNREGDKNRQAVAANPDIQQLLAAVKALGMGGLNAAVLPESVRVEILKAAASAGNPREFIDWLDTQVTESLLGQTYTTRPNVRGTHGAAGVAAEGTRRINEYDAQCLADTLERDLVYWIVALNWDEQVARRFCPKLKFGVSDPPSATEVATIAKLLTSIDVPLRARDVGEMAGMPVIDEGDEEGMAHGRTRLVYAGKDMPIEPEAGNDPNAPEQTEEGDSEGGGEPSGGGNAPPKPSAKPKTKAAAKTPKPKAGEVDGPDAVAQTDNEARARFLLTDQERSEDAEIRILLKTAPVAQIGDRSVAADVYEHMLEDYPAKSLDWIPRVGPWVGPVEVPVDELDFANANKWRASHEDISSYVDKIKKAGGVWKPIVLVKKPGNPKFVIVDGHHRTLAYRKLGWPVRAYIAHVPTDSGPWDTIHDLQKKGTSKGSWADENSPSWRASHMPSWAKKAASYQGPPPHPLEER